MNARFFVVVALMFCAVVARAEDVEAEEESSLAGVETVEPTFLEASADGFPFQLPKKMLKTTAEPRYYGESNVTPKKYVTPEYQDPKPVDPKKLKNQPVLFTSHYFSPLPKVVKGKNLKVSKSKSGRSLVPFRADVQTPTGLKLAQNGFTNAELFDGRLPNKFDDPAQNMKKTRAPAPQLSLVELDTTEEAEADAAEAPVPPPFSQADIGQAHAAVVVADAEHFYSGSFEAPTWADEQAEDEAEAATASFVEIEDETEETDESEDESEDETEEESEDEETEEDSEEEAEEEEEPVALVETDAIDMEMDEMSANEAAAAQVDMDAVSDEASMTDADEDSSDAEADTEEEEVAEDEALEEAENADAASLVEEDGSMEGVNTLLSEVDSHLHSDSDSETVVEAETEGGKGTPGSSIGAGQTWEDAQNERLDALQSKLEADKLSAPKVQAQVVSSKAELEAVDEAHQNPEYNSEAEEAETVEPEMVFMEKIAKLRALRQ